MADTNPSSSGSNQGFEKYMDNAKFQVIRDNWNNQEITKKVYFEKVRHLYFHNFILKFYKMI